ncbi:MAG: class I SAM-dependent methyltransferase [Streptosporangiales bacterium]
MPEARYDAVADFYATAFNAIDDPAGAALLDLVGSPAGLRILDLACGHGRITRELARRGADVTGADISAALIGKARQAEREHPLGPRYVHADVSSPGWHASLDAAAFDVVTCHFGLSDIDDLDGALAGASAVLRPRGRFVFAFLHPCFPGAPGVSAAVGPVLRRGPLDPEAELSVLRRQVGAQHRTLSSYLNAFRRHELWLDELREPVPASQWADSRPGADRVPVYLAGRCLKVRLPADESASSPRCAAGAAG